MNRSIVMDNRIWTALARLGTFPQIEKELDRKLIPLLSVPDSELPDTTGFPDLREIVISDLLGHCVGFTFTVRTNRSIRVEKALTLWVNLFSKKLAS